MTGSIQIKRGKYWIVLNKDNEIGQRETQIYFNTYMAERGNKKRTKELLDELSLLDETLFQNRFIIALKQFLKHNSSKISDRDTSIPEIVSAFLTRFSESAPKVTQSNPKLEEMLFCDFPPLWFEDRKRKISQTTMHYYDRSYNNHFYPYFKALGVTIKEVEEDHVKGYVEYLEGKGLNGSSLKKLFTQMRAYLAYAIKLRIIQWNPSDFVEKPKAEKYETTFYNLDEMNRLLELSKGTRLETVIYLACYFGFRRSEILGLKWDAVDFSTNMITVRNKVIMMNDEVTGQRIPVASNELKSESSRRSLPMSTAMRNYLLGVKAQQEKDVGYFGNTYHKEWDGYVCRQPDGNLIKPSYVRTTFLRFLKKHNLRYIRFHDLRHPYVKLKTNHLQYQFCCF